MAEAVARVADAAADVLASGDGARIVLGGCGTSGRIAFVVARHFNRILAAGGRAPPPFHYLCAGGDRALFASYEVRASPRGVRAGG